MKFTIQNFKTIIDPITIDFGENNIISLIGQNGSGKTNILEGIKYFFTNIIDMKPMCSDEEIYDKEKNETSVNLQTNILKTDFDLIEKIFKKWKIDFSFSKEIKIQIGKITIIFIILNSLTQQIMENLIML